ncbi:MAG TPA: rhodanese-like domain-containing protein [Phycisphaerales bacterium]|nr:rhodanese-like domain-containing protein [Phycisphaerales bacterium]
MPQTISPKELATALAAGNVPDFIDVRTPAEYREVHAQGTILIPLDQFDASSLLASRRGAGSDPVYVICRSGSRGAKACAQLEAAGCANAINVEGGTTAWDAAGLPVVRGSKKVMSIERQVRIAAGSIVLIGLAAGYFVTPWMLLLSAFIASGLIFAGITDTCGMGMMLAKMPWNR